MERPNRQWTWYSSPGTQKSLRQPIGNHGILGAPSTRQSDIHARHKLRSGVRSITYLGLLTQERNRPSRQCTKPFLLMTLGMGFPWKEPTHKSRWSFVWISRRSPSCSYQPLTCWSSESRSAGLLTRRMYTPFSWRRTKKLKIALELRPKFHDRRSAFSNRIVWMQG